MFGFEQTEAVQAQREQAMKEQRESVNAEMDAWKEKMKATERPMTESKKAPEAQIKIIGGKQFDGNREKEILEGLGKETREGEKESAEFKSQENDPRNSFRDRLNEFASENGFDLGDDKEFFEKITQDFEKRKQEKIDEKDQESLVNVIKRQELKDAQQAENVRRKINGNDIQEKEAEAIKIENEGVETEKVKEYKKKIPSIKSFEELYTILEDVGEIKMPWITWESKVIIDNIRSQRDGINGKINKDYQANMKAMLKDPDNNRWGGLDLFEQVGIKEKVLELLSKEIAGEQNPDGPNDLPPGFPPEAKKIPKEEFTRLNAGYSGYRSGGHNHYPEMGATSLLTEYGRINGKLIWCDFDIAIFETPQGYISMKFGKLVAPSGKTYEQVEKDKKVVHTELKGKEEPKQKVMYRQL